MDLQAGKFGYSHSLKTAIEGPSSMTPINQRWYHLHKQVDLQEQGLSELYIDGSLSVSEVFNPDDGLNDDIESEWIIGSGTIGSFIDEIRISSASRSAD